MWIRRILVIPAVAALAVSGAVILGAAGTASAATAAPAAQSAVIAHPARITDTYKWFKYNYYDSQVTCEARGAAMMGGSFDGGIIVDYNCKYVFGEGWLLSIEVMYGCPAGPVTPPTKVASDTRSC